MTGKNEPPKFIKPGDDPRLDALLAELRPDGEGGDPLFPDRHAVKASGSGSERAAVSSGATTTTATSGAPAENQRGKVLVLGALCTVLLLVAGFAVLRGREWPAEWMAPAPAAEVGSGRRVEVAGTLATGRPASRSGAPDAGAAPTEDSGARREDNDVAAPGPRASAQSATAPHTSAPHAPNTPLPKKRPVPGAATAALDAGAPTKQDPGSDIW